MGRIRFSVVVPTLNEEKNLGACFKSLMEQTRGDFEVIVVDGGSMDGTLGMAERYGFEVVEVAKKRPHDVGSAKNEGAKRARGEMLLFLDADMTMAPNCLEVVGDNFGNRDVVGVACRVLPLEGSRIERLMYGVNNQMARFANRLGRHELSYFSCHAYRKDGFEKVGGFREDLLACEDLDLSLRLRHLGRYVVTPRTTLYASPRRLRDWSYRGYVQRYAKYLIQYYSMRKVTDFYERI